MDPKVSIVILNWNGKDDTLKCLQSLKNITYLNYEIILVDNDSSDGSVELFHKIYPEIEIISNKQNLGFAGGNNVGIRYVMNRGTDYFLLLNNDTIVDKSFLTELIRVAESDPETTIVQSKILTFEGDVEYTYYDKYGATFSEIIKKDNFNRHNFQNPLLFYPCGACMLIQKSFINENFFDEKLFAYYEDVDIGWQARLNNYKICYAPNSICYHKGSSSLKNNKPRKMYLIWRNRFRVLMKNYSIYNLLKRFPLAIIMEFSTAIWYSMDYKNLQYLQMYLSGIYWNIQNFQDTLNQRRFIQSTRKVKDNEIEKYMLDYSLELRSIFRILKKMA